MKRLPTKQTALAADLVNYMSARENSLQLMIEGVRTANPFAIEMSVQKNDEARKLAEKLQSNGDK